MRIIFMGTPDFAVPCLERLIADGHEVAGVFTQPDRPKGRGNKLAPPPVKETAQAYHIPVWQPESLKDGAAEQILRELSPELIVVVAYGQILPKAVLDLPALGCVNVHGSLLPKYRGAAPIQWSVLNGDEFAGVTTMYMAQGLDTGDMILSKATLIGADETSGELYERLAGIGAQALSETVALIAKGEAPRTIQPESQATHAPMLSREMGIIDWTKTAPQVHNLVRGMAPWPSASTTLEGQPLKVHKVKPLDLCGEPGHVIDSEKGIVACGQGAVQLLEIQAQGGRKMAAQDYLRGHPVKKGTVLGG